MSKCEHSFISYVHQGGLLPVGTMSWECRKCGEVVAFAYVSVTDHAALQAAHTALGELLTYSGTIEELREVAAKARAAYRAAGGET